jgi:hypothetical protein
MVRRHREQRVRDPNSIDAAAERVDAADLFDAHGFAAAPPGVSPRRLPAYPLRLRWRITGVEVMPWRTIEARTTKPHDREQELGLRISQAELTNDPTPPISTLLALIAREC